MLSARRLNLPEKKNKRTTIAYQLVKDLTSEKQGRSGKCLTEEKEIDRILLRTVQL